MTTLIESLKRLYSAEKINLEKLEYMLNENKITREEFEYIIKNEAETSASI
jgi:hypothetical protein